ncbi:helix-turn-helix domain-containing protein [Sporomusa aerivorans]|uniref:helix-turn-helix domain-containing protein n=1 Tax=Sporomusa aerivorans TaxID=204936 RepID=UPI00352BB33B
MNKPTFAMSLSKLRNEHGYTQQQAADLLGISRARLNNYEQGTREPDLNTIATLAEFYNVSVDELLGRHKRAGFGKRLQIFRFVRGVRDKLIYEDALGLEWVEQEEINEDGVHYWLLVTDESMINEGIRPNDLVLVFEHADVEDRSLAVITIGGKNGTIRRVYRMDNGVVFQSANPSYSPLIGNENIHIVGKVKAIKRKY